MRLEDDMICSHCTGRHHPLACPDLHDTLIDLGVQPLPTAPRMVPTSDLPVRPWFAYAEPGALIQNVMDATWSDRRTAC